MNYFVSALLLVGGLLHIRGALFYLVLRTICTIVFGVYAYNSWENKKWAASIFLIGAIIFNPIIPLYLGKAMWQIIDVIFAVLIIVVPRICKD